MSARETCPRLVIGRNLTATRPDYFLLNDGILCLRGEDKVDKFNEAKKELKTKINKWNIMFYGGLPYTLCFASDRYEIQFFALDSSLTLYPITNSLSPSNIQKRGELILALFNMALLIEAMQLEIYQPEILKISPRLFSADTQNTKVKLIYDFTFVKKDYSESVLENVSDILKVYKNIQKLDKSSRDSHIIGVLNVDDKKSCVDLYPLGICFKPENELQLKCAIKSVCIALNIWHAEGYCHGDIRYLRINKDGLMFYL